MPENPIPPKIPKTDEPKMKGPQVQGRPQGPKEKEGVKPETNPIHKTSIPEDSKWILALVFACVSLFFLILGAIWGILEFFAIIIGVAAVVFAVMYFKNEKMNTISLIVAIVALGLALLIGGRSFVLSIRNAVSYNSYNSYNYDYNYGHNYDYDYWDYWD